MWSTERWRKNERTRCVLLVILGGRFFDYANALKQYFSDEQMKYVSVDELDYTLNALTYDVLESVINAIDNAPTITEKEKAKWIPTVNPNWPAYSHDKCSSCGWTNTKNSKIGVGRKSTKFKFCPCCGAIMEGENG